MFDKVLIANRGEIACRVIRTLKRLGVRSVAVFSQADRGALFTRLADEALEIGPAPASESYLRVDRILEVARRTGADAIHPGYGFLAENAGFARACAAQAVRFIGPAPEAIDAMGLKHAAKALMEQAGVPVVPGYHGDDQSDARLSTEAERIGFPLLIKAVAGGGGKGMRRVDAARELGAALAAARREAESAFGDGRVLLERYLEKPRHIEVQILADRYGKTLALHERDCSTQRRHQKIVEEAPAPGVSPELRKVLGHTAVRAARAVHYEGAGTVELIADAAHALSPERFYFMEMNTRLQVEHPVTELITGLDLVEWQLRVASGERLPFEQTSLPLRGHAIEVRLCAEDPATDYLPKTGELLHVRWPAASDALRVETGVEAGDQVSVFYDSMIAKLVAWGEDRGAAIRRLTRALRETQVAGVETNQAFLRAILEHAAFRAEDVHTGFLSDHRAELLREPPELAGKLIALAVVGELARRASAARAANGSDRWSPWSDVRSFRVNEPRRDRLELRLGQDDVDVELAFEGDATLIHLEGRALRVEAQRWFGAQADGTQRSLQAAGPECTSALDAGARGQEAPEQVTLLLDGEKVAGSYVTRGARSFAIFESRTLEVALRRAARQLDEDAAALGAVRSPLPGRVLSVAVSAGQHVRKGEPLLSLEAMKMEHTLRASVDGVVSELFVRQGEQVAEGSTLLVLQAAEATGEAPPGGGAQHQE
jgi:3-methylcrotonyl-CoA carboxylase alpha subunit